MKTRTCGPGRACAAALALAALTAPHAAAADWPAWRGDGTGVSSETKLPLVWDAKSGVAWSAELPGEGNSSPIVLRGRVYVTCSTGKGKGRHVLALDAASGRVVWRTDLVAGRIAQTDPKTGYAPSTPCTDGRRVYAFFDSPGLVALDLSGNVLWTRDLGPFKTSWNLAASPVVSGETVIMCCDHDAEGFIVACDAATGADVWRTPRKAGRQFSSPVVFEHRGRGQIVVNGSPTISYDPRTGAELWRHRVVKDGSDPTVPTAVCLDGLVHLTSGRNGPSFAVDPGGQGDVTETAVRMHFPTGGPYVPSPVVYPHFFIPGDNGRFLFLDDAGSLLWEDRLRDHFSSSPVAGAGRIYWASERGTVYVLDVSRLKGREPVVRLAAANRMGEQVLASPAIAGGRMFIRTQKRLCCISGSRERPRPAGEGELSGLGFDELVARYDAHKAGQGPDVLVRLDVVTAAGECDDPRAVDFLLRAALREGHWDVSEEAAKALGRRGAAAVPAVVEILASRDGRSYLKVIAAGHAGTLAAGEAVPALLKLAGERRPAIRLASMRALARIGLAHEGHAPAAAEAMMKGLGDEVGTCQCEALEGVALLATRLGERREEARAAAERLAGSPNPLVSEAARKALEAMKR